MAKTTFPFVALFLGLFFLALLLLNGVASSAGENLMPLLTLLIISEFGFIVTGIGAITGLLAMTGNGLKLKILFVAVACALLSVKFLLLGLDYWPL